MNNNTDGGKPTHAQQPAHSPSLDNADNPQASAVHPDQSEQKAGGINPDLIAGIAIVLASGGLLTRTSDMPAMTALLPVTMLVVLMVLGALLVIRVFVDAKTAKEFAPKYEVFTHFRRFIGVVASIAVYVGGVAVIGFYTTTAVMVPVIAWCFGYRNIKRLLLADAIFTGGMALIFVVLMGQELPAEFFIG